MLVPAEDWLRHGFRDGSGFWLAQGQLVMLRPYLASVRVEAASAVGQVLQIVADDLRSHSRCTVFGRAKPDLVRKRVLPANWRITETVPELECDRS